MTGVLEWWSALPGRLASPTKLAVLIEDRGFPKARKSGCIGELDAIACHGCNACLSTSDSYFRETPMGFC